MSDGRLLEDLIGDVVSGVLSASIAAGDGARDAGVRPVSVDFDLPIEMRVTSVEAQPVVRADMPQTRTRTPFNRPLGRLTMHLVAEVAR